jgi:D-alanine-D-alanine ligase
MKHLQVAVLRGGPSEEYSVSMKTGSAVIRSLMDQDYVTKDIIITRQGEWLDRGVVRDPEAALKAVDVVFVALHGTYGEDGQVQKLLQRIGLPFTGSRSFPSAIAFNKFLTKETLKEVGVLMPKHVEISAEEIDSMASLISDIKLSFGPEYIVKPLNSGSSFGIQIVRGAQSLQEVLDSILRKYERVLVEEFIEGIDATCATLENFRNERIYVFPSIEIIPPKENEFFNYEAKYSGQTMEICPARFSYKERCDIADTSALVHDVLGLSQYSRSDFMVRNGQVYFLEVNTHPGLTSESLYPKAAAAVGLSFDQLISHLVENATC